MSVCFVVVPAVIGGWPLISAAILAAGAAMGYKATSIAEQRATTALEEANSLQKVGLGVDPNHLASVELAMTESQIVQDVLGRGEKFILEREGLRAEFYVDGRGAVRVHMEGRGQTHAQLETAGRELMDKVRQQFAYAKTMEELEARGFHVTGQEVEANGSIRVRVART